MKQSLRGAVLIALGCAVVLTVTTDGSGATLFVETWEDPALASGASSSSLPSGWQRFSGPMSSARIWHPSSAGGFSDVEPLEAPAGGNQLLVLEGLNTGVSRMSGTLIQPNTIYTLSASIGATLLTDHPEFWSLQLWADTNGSGAFEGSFAGDDFIGQQFGTLATAVNPAPGSWVLNTFSFNSSTTPSLVGEQLVVFLNSFGDGTSTYDNVTLSAAPAPAAVPEPASLVLLSTGASGLLRMAHRRQRR